MRLGFSYIGLIWLIMLFVPNFIWTKNKPKDYKEYIHHANKVLRNFFVQYANTLWKTLQRYHEILAENRTKTQNITKR